MTRAENGPTLRPDRGVIPATEPAAAALEGTLALAATLVADAPPCVEEHGPAETPTRTSDAEAKVLQRLLGRMQRKGDFPAFVRNVTEISKKAEVLGDYSASHLGQAILKDYALTAKLLRVVNSHYAARFGGKIHSVQSAVVVLGFERVRSMALGISIFKVPGKREPRPGLRDSAIKALVAGEVARSVAGRARVGDGELAMICAMFKNLGQHLVMHYLPEASEEIGRLTRVECLSAEAATERVLGVSATKLGIVMAESWHLPEAVIAAMAPGEPAGTLRESDRLRALTAFANELTQAVAASDGESDTPAVRAVLERYAELVPFREKELPELLQGVRESVESRHAALVGVPGARESRYLPKAAAPTAGEGADPAPSAPRRRASPRSSAQAHDERAEALDRCLAELRQLARTPRPGAAAIAAALDVLLALGFRRALLLAPSADKRMLAVTLARGEDAALLETELVLSITWGARSDLFSAALRSGKDRIVEDAFDAKSTSRVPRPYYELIGSPTFVLYPGGAKGSGLGYLVLADLNGPEELPGPERAPVLAEVREVLSRAVGGGGALNEIRCAAR